MTLADKIRALAIADPHGAHDVWNAALERAAALADDHEATVAALDRIKDEAHRAGMREALSYCYVVENDGRRRTAEDCHAAILAAAREAELRAEVERLTRAVEAAAEAARLRALLDEAKEALEAVASRSPAEEPPPAYGPYGRQIADTPERHAELVSDIIVWAIANIARAALAKIGGQ